MFGDLFSSCANFCNPQTFDKIRLIPIIIEKQEMMLVFLLAGNLVIFLVVKDTIINLSEPGDANFNYLHNDDIDFSARNKKFCDYNFANNIEHFTGAYLNSLC